MVDQVKRFEDLLTTGSYLSKQHEDNADLALAEAWVVMAAAALEDVFPENHATRTRWRSINLVFHSYQYNITMRSYVGVFRGATELLKGGYAVRYTDVVRAETLSELLDQSDSLIAMGHLIAAAALAGGALETHLGHLCTRNNLTVTGHPSIAKYDGAISQARNAGNTIYSAIDSKIVIAWGGIRNSADHEPMKFAESKERVQMMVQGIREFLVRFP